MALLFWSDQVHCSTCSSCFLIFPIIPRTWNQNPSILSARDLTGHIATLWVNANLSQFQRKTRPFSQLILRKITCDPLPLSCLDFFRTRASCSPTGPLSILSWSSSKRDDLFCSSSIFQLFMHSSTDLVPPYSAGRKEGSTLRCRLSRLEWVLNRLLIFSLSRLLANWKISDMVQGRLRKLMSLCLIGKARSQQLKAFETSDGVQIDRWLQLTAFSSNT